MAKKNLILLSLEDSKINKIANVVSNVSCKKILDYLAGKEYATESDIAKELGLPISTVHYNMQQLMDAGLIIVDEFHYSEKGREVNRYKLANKYIIIAPKKTKTTGLKQKLKGILPVALIAAGAAGLIQLFSKYFPKTTPQVFGAGKQAMEEEVITAAPTAAEAAAEAVPAALDVARETAPVIAEKAFSLPQNIALWFLIGSLFVLAVYFVWSFRRDFD